MGVKQNTTKVLVFVVHQSDATLCGEWLWWITKRRPKGRRLKRLCSGWGGVYWDFSSPLPESGPVQVLSGGKVWTSDPLCRPTVCRCRVSLQIQSRPWWMRSGQPYCCTCRKCSAGWTSQVVAARQTLNLRGQKKHFWMFQEWTCQTLTSDP